MGRRANRFGEIDTEATEFLKSAKELGTRSVCFFNNKGGVGKTTLVANLAAQLGLALGAKILVVDADPQCNLTQYVLPDDEFVAAYSTDDVVNSIYSVVHPLSQGKGYSDALPIRKCADFGFDIIAGDPRLALKEDLLASDWRDAKAGGTRGLRTTFLFSDLIKKSKEYDFVFFDMGPSLGAINRSLLMAADFFVVPMSIDIFSLWAIRNIGAALTVWNRELENGLRMAEDPVEVSGMKRNEGLRFLGFVTQQHKERKEQGSARIVEAYNAISEKVPSEVESQLGKWFAAGDMQPHLGEIKHLASLAPKSQTLHKPMIDVSVRGSYTSLRKQAQGIYRSIGRSFLSNIVKAG